MVDVVMMEDTERGPAEAATINQAGMAQSVRQNQAICCGKTWDDSYIGGVSSRKGESRFCVLKAGQLPFQGVMRRHVAGN